MAVKFNADGKTKRQLLEQMRVALEDRRSPMLGLWRNVADFILPIRPRFDGNNNKGDRRSKKILDITGTLAARTLRSGMQSGITSPARPWFRLTTPDPELAEHQSVKEWLHICTERLRWILAKSNFYRSTPLVYGDLGVFGTAGLIIEENDKTVVRFRDFPIGTFSIGLDEAGRPSIFTRIFQMSVRQLAQRFGIENCSNRVQNHYRRANLEIMIDVVQVIHQNEEYDEERLESEYNKPFYSCYYEKPGQQGGRDGYEDKFLRESGFNEFPGLFPRWEVTGDDTYGSDCPGITALADVSQLQQGEKTSLKAIEKIVTPPMVGPESLKTARASILPGEITYINVRDGQQGFRPAHEVRFDVDRLEGKQAQVRARIERAFFADLFLMLSNLDDQGVRTEKTAAEIYERHEEKLLALGPVLEQLNEDLLDPTVTRVFAIAERRGLIPPAPPELENMELKVEYISIMHQAQKTTQLGGMRSVVEFALPIADRDPSVMDKIDTDRMIEHVAEAAGVPPDTVVPQEKVDSIRKARAAAEQEQRQSDQAASQAKTARDLAAAPTGEKNALTDLQQQASAGELIPADAGGL